MKPWQRDLYLFFFVIVWNTGPRLFVMAENRRVKCTQDPQKRISCPEGKGSLDARKDPASSSAKTNGASTKRVAKSNAAAPSLSSKSTRNSPEPVTTDWIQHADNAKPAKLSSVSGSAFEGRDKELVRSFLATANLGPRCRVAHPPAWIHFSTLSPHVSQV